MSKFELKCSSCGSVLSKTGEENLYICLHCGNKEVIKADETLITNNYNYNQQVIKKVYGKEKKEYEELIQNGETFLRLGDYKKALDCFYKAIDEFPSSYIGWWAVTKTKMLARLDGKKFNPYYFFNDKEYNNAIQLANKEEAKEIKEEYEELINKLNNSIARSYQMRDDKHFNREKDDDRLSGFFVILSISVIIAMLVVFFVLVY